jgi:choline kinase
LVHLVILAAGRGTRLRELGESRQKWLLDVGGSTIAERQLAAADIAAPGAIGSIRAVTGHAADGIASFLSERGRTDVGLVHNPAYDELNNWYSLLVALRALPGGDDDRLVVFNSDLCAEPEWFASFLDASATTARESLVGVDTGRALTDESMKVSVSGSPPLLEAIGKRGIEDPAGEYVGMFMARGAVRRDLHDALEGFVGSPDDADHWYEGAIGLTAARGTPWAIWPTPDSRWVEIDDEADFAAAQRLGAAG